MLGARRLMALGMTALLALVACGSTPTQSDPIYPACNGVSPEGLGTEATAGGQCPTHPATLVGTATAGQPCNSAADCAPTCCQCPNGGGALAAECNGSCLEGSDACCLYAQQCAN